MRITRTVGDVDFANEVFDATLKQLASRGWVIRVTHTSHPDGRERTIDGEIAEYAEGVLVIAEVDDDAMHTGASDTIDPLDITELEVL